MRTPTAPRTELRPYAGAALRVLGSAAASALTAALALLAFEPASAQTLTAQQSRGKYLVNTAGCHDCHTPFKMGANGPEPDLSRMLSGHPESLVMPPVPALPLSRPASGSPQPMVSAAAPAKAQHATLDESINLMRSSIGHRRG